MPNQQQKPCAHTPPQAPSPRGRAGEGLLLLLLLLISLPAFSQFSKPRRQYVEYLLTASHADRNYQTGEQASLTIEAYKGGLALDGVMVHYRVGDEMFLPAAEDSVAFAGGKAVIANRASGPAACASPSTARSIKTS